VTTGGISIRVGSGWQLKWSMIISFKRGAGLCCLWPCLSRFLLHRTRRQPAGQTSKVEKSLSLFVGVTLPCIFQFLQTLKMLGRHATSIWSSIVRRHRCSEVALSMQDIHHQASQREARRNIPRRFFVDLTTRLTNKQMKRI
jgi:hypothetical protein